MVYVKVQQCNVIRSLSCLFVCLFSHLPLRPLIFCSTDWWQNTIFLWSVLCHIYHIHHRFARVLRSIKFRTLLIMDCNLNGWPQGNGQHGKESHINGCWPSVMVCLGSLRCSKVSVTDSVLSQIKINSRLRFPNFGFGFWNKINRSWTPVTFHTSYVLLLTYLPVLIKLGIQSSI